MRWRKLGRWIRRIICLNSFLYVDKLTLSEMASILGKQELSEQLAKEAEVIKLYVQTKMYDTLSKLEIFRFL